MTHRSRARTVVSGVAAVALVATAAAGAASAAPDQETSAPAEPTTTTRPATSQSSHGTVHRLTLITGDVVTVTELADGTKAVDVESSAGAGYQTLTVGEDLHVVPDAARPFLASGALDEDLFNVSALIEQGVGTGGQDTAPVIVQFAAGASTASLQSALGTPTATLESLNAVALQADAADAEDMWQSLTGSRTDGTLARGVTKVYLDGLVEASLADSVPQVGAPEAWDRGIDGTGVTVAVLDSGVDLTHPDLADAVIDSQSFVPDEDVTDVHGHGTHVASTVAGSGAASEGVQVGIAPGADLIVGKVLANDGFGQESWIIDGMEWAAENADVVNMSLGTTEPSDGTDPMAVALNTISAETDTLFVVAAGNNGLVGGIGSPGAAEAALTVGAVDGTDTRTWFTSMGPRLGDALVKPDLSAPGDDVLAARSQASPGEGWYTAMSGTSMASPHIAGAAAMLLQDDPDLTSVELKNTLMSSSFPLSEGPFQLGAGRLDVPAALDAPVIATGSISFGYFDWPHEGDTPVTREITYTNDGDSAVTLSLRLEGDDGMGGTLPDGLTELSATELDIPAGGTASVDVTLDPAIAPMGATLSGFVIASAGGTDLARTGWGVMKEEERYDLTLRATDLDGEPSLAYVVFKGREEMWPYQYAVDGEMTLRLPAGTYAAMSFMDVEVGAADALGVAMVGDPQIELTQDTVVELDARDTSEITVDVDDDVVEPTQRRMEFSISGGTGLVGAYNVPLYADHLFAAPMDGTTDGDFEYLTRWRLRTPFITVAEDGNPLDVSGMFGSAMPTEEITFDAVYAGTGTPAELAAVETDGKAVVITRDQSLDMIAIAAADEAAGAGLLVVVNDEPGEFTVGVSWEETLSYPAAAVSGVEGAGLISRIQSGPVQLTVGGSVDSPVVYDLVDPHPGSIPTDLAYAPGNDELARIDADFHGNQERDGGEFRYDFRPHTAFGVGGQEMISLPIARTEYVSAQEGTEWYQDAVVVEGNWNERGVRQGYEPGSTTAESWFAAIVQPRLGAGYWGPNRQGDMLQVNLPSWAGDEPIHTGGMGNTQGDDDQTIRWYQGDTLLAESIGWQSDWIVVDTTEKTQYRVTNEVGRPTSWGTTPASSTEWVFWTEMPADWTAELPFLQLDFAVDTDWNGAALDGPTGTIGLSAWHLPGTHLAGEVTEGTLAVSYDQGATWEELELTGEPGDWSAEVTYPAGAETVSLRATAVDSEGNAITQELYDAYLVPEATGPSVERISGADRYATAAQIAAQYPDGADTVYVVTGEDFADALAGAAPASEGRLPGSVGLFTADGSPAPVLLVKSDRIPAATKAALDVVQPQRLVVLGGEGAISEDVATQLGAWGQVDRIAGESRYETAALLSELYPAGVETVYVASGEPENFPDALAGAALAGHEGVPVLLTQSDHVPAVVTAALERLDAGEVVVLGGDGAVSDEVFAALGADRRLSGVDRYATAAAISAQHPAGAANTFVATGLDWPDALTGSALAAYRGEPVNLTRTAALPAVTRTELERLQPGHATVLGGAGVVSDDVVSQLTDLLAGWL